jgi:hypothetical protein
MTDDQKWMPLTDGIEVICCPDGSAFVRNKHEETGVFFSRGALWQFVTFAERTFEKPAQPIHPAQESK